MNNEKMVKAITKLIRLTLEGEIEWEEVRPGPLSGVSLEKAYVTQYKGQTLKVYRPSPLAFSGNSVFSTSGVMLPTSRAKLEVVDADGKTKSKFPSISAIDELFKVASMGSVALNIYVDQILADD